MSKTTIVAGVAGAVFLGYCIYFDHKRRNAKDFKKKLHDKRAAQEEWRKKKKGNKKKMKVDLNNHEDVQRYFLEQIQKGELLISQGMFDEGVQHLSNAVLVCGQPTQLLQVLQQTLPSEIFTSLIQRIREYSNEMGGDDSNKEPTLNLKEDINNDDLE